MLGSVISTGRGAGDRLVAAVAEELEARGVAVAGAVQLNVEHDPARPCHMDLRILGQGDVLRISEDRGRHARGCRLDAIGLAEAVARVERDLDRSGVALVIVNKFGKQEAEGGGFREAIGKALVAGVPVLTAVSKGNLPEFLTFAEGLATEVPPDFDSVLAWCLDAEAAAREALRA